MSGRRYHRCPVCELTFLHPTQLPTAEEERQEYLLHENDPADPGYRRHLERLTEPLLGYLKPGNVGLDYGCGPGPAIAAMLKPHGLTVHNYDPIFVNEPERLETTYDFVVCTEVVEHFHRPHRDFVQLALILKDTGRLGVMTEFLGDSIDFGSWPYRRERSHVSFYREQTMDWIAQRHGWDLDIVSARVAIFSGQQNERLSR